MTIPNSDQVTRLYRMDNIQDGRMAMVSKIDTDFIAYLKSIDEYVGAYTLERMEKGDNLEVIFYPTFGMAMSRMINFVYEPTLGEREHDQN